jgi:hypothetical protein
MKWCSRTLFRHCRICRSRHFFSHMRQWIWDLCWSISPPEGLHTPPRCRGGVCKPPGDEMLQQDPVLPLPHLLNWAHFSHICVNGFGTCVGAFHPLEDCSHPLGAKGVCVNLEELKWYSRTLFRHCRICRSRHFFSHMRHWFWHLCWSISHPGGLHTPLWCRGGVCKPPGDEML